VHWGTDTKNPVNISQLSSKCLPTKEEERTWLKSRLPVKNLVLKGKVIPVTGREGP
jgi:hypothetical protein